MLGSDALRALAMAALVVIGVAHLPVVLAPAVAALSTAAGSAYPPCVVAVLPQLATTEQLPAANAARVSITYICVVAGPLFGAILLLLGSPSLAFALNGGTFVLGGLAVAALPRQALAHRPARTRSPTTASGASFTPDGRRCADIRTRSRSPSPTSPPAPSTERSPCCWCWSASAEVVGDTALQRSLDPAVFARAYGLVIPACVAAIAVGALLAPLSVSILGVGGTFLAVGAGVLAYAALLLAPTERRRRSARRAIRALRSLSQAAHPRGVVRGSCSR